MRRVHVKNKMQEYTYTCTKPVGKKFDERFTPDLTPQEMLEIGVFDGKYWEETPKEFPASWFIQAKLAEGKPDSSLNFFGVHASQPLRVWQAKGWIHPDDPHGWFEWYCRYYQGRRHEDDKRQIKRWQAIQRHVGALRKNCLPRDLSCRPRQRQALLHWAIDSRKI